ncbi:MAG: FAD-binding protein [Bacteroidetes bacterium]|nr:MAG: FAD-binding protein [Bacteroidota bacterium]
MARDIVEISIPIKEYETNRDNLLDYFKSRVKASSKGINAIKTLKKSLDARKTNIKYNLRLEVFTENDYPDKISMPTFSSLDSNKTVHIIGFGPAGIFAALQCLQMGIKPIVIERGKAVKERRKDVAKLNRSGEIDPESNYCYGEGGAGTFSDGKLYTRSMKRGKIQEILELFVLHGADENILYEAHPHIGTNKLPQIIEKLRETIIEKGGEVRFGAKLTDFKYEDGKVTEVAINNKWEFSNQMILATGHSARDIYSLLHERKVALEAKPFAMGFRIEHPQTLINTIQYHNEQNASILPPASYSLVTQVKGKGAFSFCMCPGGIIAPAATDNGEVVVNGWSPSKRNGEYANSGWVTEIGEEEWKDFKHYGPLAGLEFQKNIEQRAYQMGGEKFKVPAQNLTDYLAERKTSQLNESSYHPGMTSVDLNSLYPKEINYRLREGLRAITKKLKGFDHIDAIVTGPESRTSAPVRIPRTRDLHHVELTNLYPCGEGAGFAGGIISAAVDGVRVVKAIATKIES